MHLSQISQLLHCYLHHYYLHSTEYWRLVRVIERLLDQAELFALRLVKSRRHRVILLEPLEREDEELPVVLVRERRERDGGELAG